MDQHDGALPVSVEYQTFQQMYSTLQSGIQAGLLDVVNEAFSRTLIPPQVKSVSCNLSTGEPARAQVFLDSLLHRTKTYHKTFDEFAALLEDIPSFKYLADDMRKQREKLAEERRKKMEELQVERAAQVQRRQDLGLQFPVDPVDTSDPLLSSGRTQVAHPEAYSSPSMYTATRRIDHYTSPPPISANPGHPKKFNLPVQVALVTSPELDPNSLPSGLGIPVLPGMLAKQTYGVPASKQVVQSKTMPMPGVVRNPEHNSQPLSTTMFAKNFESPPPLVTSSTPIPASQLASGTLPASQAQVTSTSLPDTPLRQPEMKHPPNAPTIGPVRELDMAVSSTSDQSPSEHPTENKDEKAADPSKVSSTQSPSRCVTAPTPTTSLPLGLPSSNSDDKETSVVIGLRPRSNSFSSHRGISVESSTSDCSHDFSTPPTSLESEIEASQESNGTHCNDVLVDSVPKVKRSISCEKCCKKKSREFERTIAEQQLEITRLTAAYDSQSKKLIDDQQGLESELYELRLSLEHHKLANMELQRRNEELFLANQTLLAEKLKKDEEICRIKADAWDESRVLRKALEEKQVKPRYIQCGYCKVTFSLHT